MYIQPNIENRVEKFLSITEKNMGGALGISFTSFKSDEVTATMPVDENTIQPFGLLHGGASVALAETLASIGAWLNIEEEGKTAVGVEINANHVRSAQKGETVRGVSKPIHTGRQTQVWETKIFNEDEKLVCISRCTLAVVDI
ncbi:hotdog fold thioesterase [Fodinibius sp. Rm-B-1B1-1]|uniref:hotdog fold thioesterase n=1 Tax=Fodinibius alkaliphilus TaxID=3140241 RepID=UPI00315B3E77